MAGGREDEYQGIPIRELRIESVDWSYRADHISLRSQRKGSSELDVDPEWATEAVLDPRRVVRRTRGLSIKVVGRSSRIGRLLKVWLVPKELAHGQWWGASACEANESDRRVYERS